MHKIWQSGGVFGSGRLLGSLIKTGFPLIGNVLKPLTKSVLMPLGLTAVAYSVDAAIHEKMFRSGCTTLIIFNEEINHIIFNN